MIVAEDVSYEYPRVRALEGVSFSLEAGAIAALVGPNGAGKTTLLRCLAALERPYSGAIRIDGMDTATKPRQVHRCIGYLSDFFGLYGELTVERCLQHAALSGGLSHDDAVAAVARTAERLGLTERLGDAAGTLSRGLRQRLGIAQAIIHSPKVLLLDEPASGLDPEARHSLSGLFRELRDEGMTLLVSSHILAELEDYATEVLYIRDGRLVRQTAVREETGDIVRLRLDLAGPVQGLAETLAGISNVTVESVAEDHAILRCSASMSVRQSVLEKLVAAGVPVAGLAVTRERLQDAYMSLAEQQSGEGEPR